MLRSGQDRAGPGRAARREGALNTRCLDTLAPAPALPPRVQESTPGWGSLVLCDCAAAISSNPQDDGCREKSGSVVMPLRLLEQMWIMYTNYTHVNTHSLLRTPD